MSSEIIDSGGIDPGGTAPRDVADEMFAHGVLEHLAKDGPAAQRRRLAALHARLQGGAQPVSASPGPVTAA